jgi:hypothetical protein
VRCLWGRVELGLVGISHLSYNFKFSISYNFIATQGLANDQIWSWSGHFPGGGVGGVWLPKNTQIKHLNIFWQGQGPGILVVWGDLTYLVYKLHLMPLGLYTE